MEFLLDNPVIAFILLAVLGLTILTVSKMVNEITLNNALKLKQQSMRVASKVTKGFGARMSLLGAQVVAPVAIVVMAFVFAPPSLPDVPPVIYDSDNSTAYQLFESNNELLSVFSKLDGFRQYPEAERGIFYNVKYLMFDSLEMTADAVTTGAPEADMDISGTGSDDYSETNNQVAGVDELDDVLTDGKFIYSIYGYEMQITLAYTQEQGPSVLGLYKEFDYSAEQYCEDSSFYPNGLYVDDDYLVVIGRETVYDTDCDDLENPDDSIYIYDFWYWGYHGETTTKVLVYDKSSDFELVDEYELDGDYINARKIVEKDEDGNIIQNSLYIVTRSWINYQYEDFDVQESLPYIEHNGSRTTAIGNDVYFMDDENPYSYTTFYGIDLNTKETDMEVILGNQGYTLYASVNNLYLVGTIYNEVEEVVTNERGESKIVNSYERKTMIMRVGIDNGDVDYNKVGFVDGFNLNQFSMDEYDGYFRIVTSNEWWGNEINNRLWVLDENLESVGLLENIGKVGERVQSVRFVGEYAYVVTFLQTDPFYVIDLSDPTNPTKDGELEIPGFSTYLQPLGANHMLGIGFDADDDGRTTGLKVQIYDISDKTDPFVFTEAIFAYDNFGYVWSDATYNHKDLLVSLDKGLIALPFSTSGWINNEHIHRSGIVVLKFDLENGFETKMEDSLEVTDYEFVVHEDNNDYSIDVHKAKFIDDYFYTISNKYIKVSTIEDTETELHSVQLRVIDQNNYGYWYFGWGPGIMWD